MNIEQFGKLNYLGITNLRTIEVIETELKDKSFVPISGPNGAGKSTVLDSLMMLFNGGSVPAQVIRDGGDKAEITIKTSTGVTVTKRIRLDKNNKQVTDIVMHHENKVINKPQVILKELFGGFITPNKTASASGAALYKSIIAQSGINFEVLEFNLAEAKEKVSVSKAMLKNLGVVKQPEGEEPTITEYNRAEHLQVQEELRLYKEHLSRHSAQSATVVRMTAELEKETLILNKMNKSLEQERASIPQTKKKNEEFESLLENQQKLESWKIFHKYVEDSRTLDQDIREWRSKVLELEDTLSKSYASADTGLENLTITADKNVLLNGLPWENACFSDKMKASAILGIKNNPADKLPIMFIEHGESLSIEKRNEIAKVAIDKGAIVFIEVFMEDTSNVDEGIVLQLPDVPYIPNADVVDVVDIPDVPAKTPIELGMVKGSALLKAPLKDNIEIKNDDIWGDL